MAMLVDLQRCRRMVASMRGLVMASSLRLQLLKEAQEALAEREKRICGKVAPLSPRSRYLRDFQAQRICIIQRQWRKHRWHRVIVEKIKMERRWRAKRGNKRLELNATTIQRVFRGHRVRKKRTRKPQLSMLATVILAQQQSRLERLHNTHLQYAKRLESRRSALKQAKHDFELALIDKASTEEKIAKAASINAVAGKPATLFVDAKLLDGTVVRMEGHQLLLHQISEVDRLTEALGSLKREIAELENSDPTVHQAASTIQSIYRRYRERKYDDFVRKRQRLAEIRRRLSSEHCYERMNAGFQVRQRKTWQRNALIISGLYHIIVAKRLRQHHREKRAVATIEHAYRQRLDRVDAQRRVEWCRAKLRAQLFTLRRLRQVLLKTWHQWQNEVARQRQRRARIPQALADGQTKWITQKALRLQRLFRRAMELRRCLDDQVVPMLHPGLHHTISTAVVGAGDLRNQFLQFYQQITQTMRTWQVPTKQLYVFAHRYALPLDTLPLDEIWTWLLNQQQSETGIWFLDLRTPFTVRTLRFLAPLSRFFDLYDRVSYQVEQIWLKYEALHCVREYLVLLFAHDAVAYTPATTFSSQLRERAIASLKQLMIEENLSTQWIVSNAVSPFTRFHCVWADLCEQCLAMPVDQSARVCTSCGHRHVEKSTATQPSHPVAAQPLDVQAELDKPQWIRPSERCDFLILNAFFHALAPRGHVHRDLYSPETLWKIALAKALEPVTVLYEQFGIRTLNELLVSEPATWTSALPMPVATKLELFVQLIKQELVAIQQNARA